LSDHQTGIGTADDPAPVPCQAICSADADKVSDVYRWRCDMMTSSKNDMNNFWKWKVENKFAISRGLDMYSGDIDPFYSSRKWPILVFLLLYVFLRYFLLRHVARICSINSKAVGYCTASVPARSPYCRFALFAISARRLLMTSQLGSQAVLSSLAV